MTWTIDEAVELLKRTFPSMAVVIADGEYDYLVGTVEDSEETIFASFHLSLDSSGKIVTEIRISDGQKYCGFGVPSKQSKSLNHVVPIQITSREENGRVWGMVGDYEVCINSAMTKTLDNLVTGPK